MQKILAKKFKNLTKKKKNKNSKRSSINFNKEIELKNLNFSYDLKNSKKIKFIFENLNLIIKKGDCVGIQGESGSGKSTLIDLIIGLQKPSAGKILIDGSDMDGSVESWQEIIGCVPQEVFILDDSLKKNIAFGLNNQEISDEKIKKSLEFSNLNNFLSGLENHLETIIGENGLRLSGGQKQRIGIARAIYNNPDILIFDESTSSLDVETEEK